MKTRLVLTNQIAEVERLKTFFTEFGQAQALSLEVIQDMNLVFEELVSNIIFYGYNEDTQQPRIEIDIARDPENLLVTITDDAKPFNILEAPEPDLDIPFDEREIGGMGIHLIKTLVDNLEYNWTGNRNVVTMTKRLAAASS